jgi:hypothetical protein
MPECESKMATASHLSNFQNFFHLAQSKLFPVMIGDPETKQQSMEWQHSTTPTTPQKNSECKNLLEKFLPASIFWDQDSILLIILQRAKLSTQSILKEKCHVMGRSPRQCPSSLGTCNPEETGLPGLSPLPWTGKPIEKSPFFI